MRELGWIKWFGGHNSRTRKENDYGFIERPGDSSVFVHRSEVMTSSHFKIWSASVKLWV
jgi:hypothetical protein